MVSAGIAVAGLLGSATAGATPTPSRLQQDTSAIHRAGVVGVQARVVAADGRARVATAGTGDRRTGRPVPANGRFRIASTGKTFKATVVLQLVGEGRMSLNDPVERWLPGLIRGNDNDGRRITVRQLLQHTHGLADDMPGYYDTEADFYDRRFDVYTSEELVARTLRHEPLFGPGEQWSYSNIGYVLVGMIIERVTGRHWHDELRDRVIRPLGLKHTGPDRRASLPSPHARSYQSFEQDRFIDVTEQILDDRHGSLVSTTRDVNEFLRALLGGRLLRPALLAEMLTSRDLDPVVAKLMPDSQYGLGIFRRPLPCGGYYWAHGGGEGGFINENGVTEDGRRSAVVSMSSVLGREWNDALAQQRIADQLVGNALCATKQ